MPPDELFAEAFVSISEYLIRYSILNMKNLLEFPLVIFFQEKSNSVVRFLVIYAYSLPCLKFY